VFPFLQTIIFSELIIGQSTRSLVKTQSAEQVEQAEQAQQAECFFFTNKRDIIMEGGI
jgi:hypothetical protein